MEENEKGLQRIKDFESILPFDTNSLNDDEKRVLANKDANGMLDIKHDFMKKVTQSKVAEHDMAVISDKIEKLDSEKKFYTINEKIKTGSGELNVNIKGGDTKFILPILITIGCIILGIIAILALK